MTTERTGTASPEKSRGQLAEETRLHLEELRGNLTENQRSTDKKRPTLERATANLDFLAAIGQDPQLRGYLERTQSTIDVCHQRRIRLFNEGYVQYHYVGGPSLHINELGEIRFRDREDRIEWQERNPVDTTTLQTMWDQNTNRGIIKKLAKMRPDQIVQRIQSQIK